MRAALLVLAVGLVLACSRYEVEAAPNNSNVSWRLDRWTGEVCRVYHRQRPDSPDEQLSGGPLKTVCTE